VERPLSRLRREVLPGRQDLLALEHWRIRAQRCIKTAALQEVERPLSRLRREVLPGRQDLLAQLPLQSVQHSGGRLGAVENVEVDSGRAAVE
jgi:hypothetical protein